jgi:capsular polysaccharide biosynthesis protein
VELRTYWAIIWRRIWLVALVVIVVGLYAGYQYYHLRKIPGALTSYHSNVTIEIGLQNSPQVTNNQTPNYSDELNVAATLADSLATGPTLTSSAFDTAVSQQIGQDTALIAQHYGANADLGDWQNPGAIGGALSATALHNLVTVTVTWTTPAGAWAIANAVGEVSVAHIGSYVNYTTGKITANEPTVSATVISSATLASAAPGPESNKKTFLLLLLLVGLIIGIALTFLADYLDDRIHNKNEVAQLLQLPVYGDIPRPPAVGKSEPVRR